jgi:hypothetical protein
MLRTLLPCPGELCLQNSHRTPNKLECRGFGVLHSVVFLYDLGIVFNLSASFLHIKVDLIILLTS